MSVFPTTKTVPLDKDIGVTDAKTQSISTAAREQLSVVLDALDGAIASNATTAAAAVSAEATARINADANLQSQINSEITNRTNAVAAEAATRLANDNSEIANRTAADTILQGEIDGERSLLRMTVPGTGTTVSVASAIGTRSTDSTGLGLANGSLISDYAGGTVNFSTGIITGGGTNFTPINFAGNASKWAKYAIVLLPTIPNSLLIIPGTAFGTTFSNAPTPAFSGGVTIGIVGVQDNGTAGVGTISNIAQTNLIQFEASGSGSGSGSGSPLDPQADETFTYYTRSDFSVDAKKFFASTTGSEQILGLKKIILGVGQQFVSTDLTGPAFQSDNVQINIAQARLMYNSGLVDENPTVELSNDGGNTWTAATVSLPGSASAATYNGNIIEADVNFTASSTASFDGGTANGTLTSAQKIAAILTPTYRLIVSKFSMNLRSSATAGTVVGKIYSVSSGIPNVLLGTSYETYIAGQDFNSTASYLSFTFGNIPMTGGTQYAIAIEGTGLNANLSVDQVTSPPSFSNSSASGTVSYVASGSGLAFRLFGQGGDLRLRVTSSTAASELAGFGVEYVSDSPAAVRGDASYEVRTLTYTEASTGTIALNAVRYTVGAHQLLAISSNHIMTGSTDFTEVSGSQVQFPANFFQQGDVVIFYNAYGLVDGSSQSLGKLNTMYDAVVGSSTQVSSGYATHSTLTAAITAVTAGSKILILPGTYTETVNINKSLIIEGKGHSSVINGAVTIANDYSTIRDLKFAGNINISANGCFVRDCFCANTSVISDTGTANSKLIISE